MSVDAYAYQEGSASNSFSSSIFKGVFRFRERVHRALALALNGRAHPGGDHRDSGVPRWRAKRDASSARIMLLAPEGGCAANVDRSVERIRQRRRR